MAAVRYATLICPGERWSWQDHGVRRVGISGPPKAVLGDRGFRASELDSVGLYKDWVAQINGEIERATTSESSGVHVDLSFERRLFSELLEIVPPGLDEVLAI